MASLIGVNGQQILVDAGRGIVVVKLSSWSTYIDEPKDLAFVAGYEAIVAALTGEAGYALRE